MHTKITTLLRTARPAFLLLTPCCLSVAVAFAISEGVEIDPARLALIVTGALSAHISVNMLNEYYDYRSGLDLRTQRTAFSGGSGALPECPEAAEAVLHGGLLCLALTALIGLYFVWQSGLGLLPVGLAGVLLVYLYSPDLARRPLLYMLAPGLGFGPLMISGAYYLLSGHYQPAVLITAVIVLFVVSNLLLLNQFPDLEADREAGRLHLPILIGRKSSARVYVAFLAMAYALLLLSVFLKLLPIHSLLGMATLFWGISAARLVLRFYDNTAKLMPALALNAALALSLPVLISLGLIWQNL
ncbi:MAG: prenyltransferase [Methylobacter sp.]|uniref:prenyltransferase n=1 Tax=Methylobacter sp. TaxID=2051955 RepID=UPI0025911963|nr:prenyltransferase [Methylobacter sp.]MCL7421487.1 prenyltransferase [Methylobacter sp.]